MGLEPSLGQSSLDFVGLSRLGGRPREPRLPRASAAPGGLGVHHRHGADGAEIPRPIAGAMAIRHRFWMKNITVSFKIGPLRGSMEDFMYTSVEGEKAIKRYSAYI